MHKKKKRSELVKYILENKQHFENDDSYKTLYPEDNLTMKTTRYWLKNYSQDNTITIDCRSESEYQNSHLPSAINFPILNDTERDEVGFLYKNISPGSALFHAENIRKNKSSEISHFCQKLKDYKNIYVYCWRGGGRSTAFVHILKTYNIESFKIIGGYKSFRKLIYHTLYKSSTNLKFLVISGLTGSGKTEILEKMNKKLPVLDLEKAALHASSLFGKIRFKNKAFTINSQQEFETRIFMQIYYANKQFPNTPIITESESRKISNFLIPVPLFKKLVNSPTIKINSSLSDRVKRIQKEYFYDNGKQITSTLKESNYFKKVIGKNNLQKLLEMLQNKQFDQFSEWFLINYYDQRYKCCYQNIIDQVDHQDINLTINQIENIINNYKKNQK